MGKRVSRNDIAVKAMFAILESGKWPYETNEQFARACFKLADEMIKASEPRCADTGDMFGD